MYFYNKHNKFFKTIAYNNTNSRFYDSTYYKTAKSNFAKASYLSFSPNKNTMTNQSKGYEVVIFN